MLANKREGVSLLARGNREKHSTALVLLSGGIDSATCLAYLKKRDYSVSCLHVSYGQLSERRELAAASRIAKHYRTRLLHLSLKHARKKGGGLIVGRNAFLINTAMLEMRMSSGVIALGVHSGVAYVDCTGAFIEASQRVVDLCCDGKISILAPFQSWGKADIWDFAKKSKVPLDKTYSCELGLAQPCGRCHSCNDLQVLLAGAE
jgi:7-cyano-7-deazaguanine synthase